MPRLMWGVCANDRHRAWLDEVVNKLTLAASANKAWKSPGQTDKDADALTAKIMEHFPTELATAQRMLREAHGVDDAVDSSEAEESDSE